MWELQCLELTHRVCGLEPRLPSGPLMLLSEVFAPLVNFRVMVDRPAALA